MDNKCSRYDGVDMDNKWDKKKIILLMLSANYIN